MQSVCVFKSLRWRLKPALIFFAEAGVPIWTFMKCFLIIVGLRLKTTIRSLAYFTFRVKKLSVSDNWLFIVQYKHRPCNKLQFLCASLDKLRPSRKSRICCYLSTAIAACSDNTKNSSLTNLGEIRSAKLTCPPWWNHDFPGPGR